MTKKQHISLRTKLAAALLQMRDGQGEFLIPYEHAKAMTTDQLLSLFHFDHHPIPEAIGGPTTHWNLVPRLIPEHREKTARQDIPAIRKADRVSTAHREFNNRMLMKAGVSPSGNDDPETEPQEARRPRTGSRWPKRPFPKRRTA